MYPLGPDLPRLGSEHHRDVAEREARRRHRSRARNCCPICGTWPTTSRWRSTNCCEAPGKPAGAAVCRPDAGSWQHVVSHEPATTGVLAAATGGVAGGRLQQGGRRSRRHRGATRRGTPDRSGRRARRLIRRVPDSGRRRMRNALGAGGLQQARRRRRTARDDPVQGHRRQDRLAGHQPGRAGRIRRRGRRVPGVDAAAVGARALRPRRLRPARRRRRRRRGVVQLRRRQRPAAGRPSGRLLARGRRAHRAARPRTSCSAASTRSGKEFLANVGTASVVKDLDAMRAALGDDKLTYLGYSYGTRIGGGVRRRVPAERAGDDARRRDRPECRSGRGGHPPGGGLPEGVRRLRRRLREGPDLSAGHRPGQEPSTSTRALVDPLVETARRRPGIRAV